MTKTLYTGVQILDGSGADPFAGEVLVEGNRIGEIARDGQQIARDGSRVMTISPGPFDTPLFGAMPANAHRRLLDAAQFPDRAGKPAEYGQLVVSIVENPMLNGETIRLDGALRMPPKG